MNYPIGVFDSGIGGLTVFKEIVHALPHHDFIYLGDTARTPYGTRDFETIYRFTKECVFKLFEKNCHLVILACNTASAKALRTIQQKDLPAFNQGKKNPRNVLGVIRPTTEIINQYTKSNHIGILATEATVSSKSYVIEINKLYPHIHVYQQACPMWVPIVEHGEHQESGADYFVEKYCSLLLNQSSNIDAVLLGCTHYPLLEKKIRQAVPSHIQLISQGKIVAQSLKHYLERHTDLNNQYTKNSSIEFYTSGDVTSFNTKATIFWNDKIAFNINAKKTSI